MSKDKKSFWTSLPGILSGVAAVIGATAGILALYTNDYIGNETAQTEILRPQNRGLSSINMPTNLVEQEETVTIKEYKWKDGLAKIVAYTQGAGVNKDIVLARIWAEKDAMKKIKKKLINRLSESPYNLDREDAIAVFEEGEIIELEYQNNGEKHGTLLKYQIKVPTF